jgi:hypothetical protein
LRPASIVRSKVTALWIVFDINSSSIMPLTAASMCSNLRAETDIWTRAEGSTAC